MAALEWRRQPRDVGVALAFGLTVLSMAYSIGHIWAAISIVGGEALSQLWLF